MYAGKKIILSDTFFISYLSMLRWFHSSSVIVICTLRVGTKWFTYVSSPDTRLLNFIVFFLPIRGWTPSQELFDPGLVKGGDPFRCNNDSFVTNNVKWNIHFSNCADPKIYSKLSLHDTCFISQWQSLGKSNWNSLIPSKRYWMIWSDSKCTGCGISLWILRG